jgi:outer membrane protein OmpA-like peptidoglycan-associated protein
MANDWATDVKKYEPGADDGVIAGIVRYCGIALQKVDSSLVSFSDPTELTRVRNNFLKKKCGLTDSDEVLDAAIAKVGERMKDDRTKNRVTVYYLLSDHFGLHHLFTKAAKGGAAVAAAPVAAAATLAAVPAAAAPEPAPVMAAVAPPSASVAPVAAAAVGAAAVGGGLSALGHWSDASPLGKKLNLGRHSDGSGAGMLWGLLLGLGLIALLAIGAMMWPRAAVPVADVAPVSAPVAAVTAPVVPEGAGVITEVRETKPVAKVYFETGKSDVSPELAPATDAFRSYLAANPGSIVGISGYNDPTGNAAANAELSKRRAQAVRDTLVEAGIAEGSIELIKPAAATDATVSKEEARRVEVYIK